jgi:hypothetical protein
MNTFNVMRLCLSTTRQNCILECIAAVHQFPDSRRGHKRRGGGQRDRECVDGASGDGGSDLKETQAETEKYEEKCELRYNAKITVDVWPERFIRHVEI